jgi:SAM-dependent methyltransferase
MASALMVDSLSPSDWVVRHASTLPQSATVLDVACGTGRHARWFAARGHLVTALDVDVEALQSLAGVSGITTLCADLEHAPWPLPRRRFQVVVVTRYLHRPLFAALLGAVDDGGLLIYETFARGNEQYGKPSNPAFLLKPGELLDTVRGQMRVLAYEDRFVEQPKPAMIQRICARKEQLDPAE